MDASAGEPPRSTPGEAAAGVSAQASKDAGRRAALFEGAAAAGFFFFAFVREGFLGGGSSKPCDGRPASDARSPQLLAPDQRELGLPHRREIRR